MREDSPRWEQINPSEFPHELDGLRELASYLPDADPYHVRADVEFVGTDGSINEIDALVLTPSGLFVLELKHWQGEIGGDGMRWMRRQRGGRRRPTDNPAILANRKAKRLASLIRFYARQQPAAPPVPYVGAAIFLHARNMTSTLDPIGRQHVYGLDGHDGGLPSMKEMLLARPDNPRHLVDAVRARQIVELVKGAKIRPSVAQRRVNNLLLGQRLFAEGVGWQDFLTEHTVDPALLRRVRFYLTSRAAEEDVPAIKRAAEREFRVLQGIHHPGIARATDLAEHPWGPAVVFDHDRDWVRLDEWLAERDGRLQLAQRLQLVQDLAEIVDYAHSRRLAHRSLHPRAIFVCDPDGARPSLVVTDWQTGGRLAGTRRSSWGSGRSRSCWPGR